MSEEIPLFPMLEFKEITPYPLQHSRAWSAHVEDGSYVIVHDRYPYTHEVDKKWNGFTATWRPTGYGTFQSVTTPGTPCKTYEEALTLCESHYRSHQS